jgi:hypothetical protein
MGALFATVVDLYQLELTNSCQGTFIVSADVLE